MEIIDIHPHVISSYEVKYPRAPAGRTLSDWSRDHPVDCEGLIAAQNATGVAKAVSVFPTVGTWLPKDSLRI